MPRKNPKTSQRNTSRRKNPKPNNIKGNLPGSLTAFNTGNKHENGGIELPAYNAEVEKGETKVGSYIFSDSSDMKLTKTLAKKHGIPEKYAGKTFAKASEEIQDKYSERENDPYTKNAMDREIDDLNSAQEEKRKEKAMKAFEKFRSLMSKNGEDIMKGGEFEYGGSIMDMLGEYEYGGKMYDKGGNLVKADETEGDEGKYPVNSADDVKDAWKLRNHAKGLNISQEELNNRIKNAAKKYDVDLGKDKKENGGELSGDVKVEDKLNLLGKFRDNYISFRDNVDNLEADAVKSRIVESVDKLAPTEHLSSVDYMRKHIKNNPDYRKKVNESLSDVNFGEVSYYSDLLDRANNMDINDLNTIIGDNKGQDLSFYQMKQAADEANEAGITTDDLEDIKRYDPELYKQMNLGRAEKLSYLGYEKGGDLEEYTYGGNAGNYGSTTSTTSKPLNQTDQPTSTNAAQARGTRSNRASSNMGTWGSIASAAPAVMSAASSISQGNKRSNQIDRSNKLSEKQKQKLQEQQQEKQAKQIDSAAASTLGAINPLIGAAYGVGSKAGRAIAPDGQMASSGTSDEGAGDKAKRMLASAVHPAGSTIENIQEHGVAEGLARDAIDTSTFGMVDTDQIFKYGGDMKKYNLGGDADGEDDSLDEAYNQRFSTTTTESHAMTPREREYYFGEDDYEPMSPAEQRAVLRRRQNPQGFENQGTPGQPGTLEGENNLRDYGFDSSLSTMQKVAPFIKPAVGAATMIGGPEEVDYSRVSPEEIDYEQSRDIARRQAALQQARSAEAIRKNANSAGQVLQGNIAANVGSQRNLTNALMKSRMRQQNKNVQISNRAERLNRQIERMEEQAQAKNEAMFDQNLTGIAGDVGRGIQGIERDRKRYDSQNRFNRAYMDNINQRYSNYNTVPVEDEEGNIRYVPRFQSGE